jgi:hypothetical protein
VVQFDGESESAGVDHVGSVPDTWGGAMVSVAREPSSGGASLRTGAT